MDPYSVLGLSSNATQEEIKSAFRRLAKETHPDLNGGTDESAARFRRIAEAYAILSDPIQKSQLDFALHEEPTTNVNSHYSFNNDVKYTARAIEFAIHMIYEEIKPYKIAALKELFKGLAWLVGGLLITGVSWQAAVDNGGGTYIVTYGAIIFGAIQAARGLTYYVKAKKLFSKAESELWSKIV